MAILTDDMRRITFADICSPGTVADLQANPAIEIDVVDPILSKGWRFKGTAEDELRAKREGR